MLSKQVDVKIHKGALTVIPKTVYEHEIKLLEILYGVGAVVPYDRREYYSPQGKGYYEEGDVVVYDVAEIDYDNEYTRLLTTYDKHPTINLPLVEHCYGDQEDRKLEKMNNEKYADEDVPVHKDDVVVKGSLSANSEEVSKDEEMNYNDMTKMQLKDILDERKVSYPRHNVTKPALLALVEGASV
tara:strand:+ start:37 stop:591 length:555 start_codon:yes stop_codon:yes gene_type:complete